MKARFSKTGLAWLYLFLAGLSLMSPQAAHAAVGILSTPYAFVSTELPLSNVAMGPDGNLYGTVQNGGASTHGYIYRVTPSGSFSIVHSFAGGATDGASPQSGLYLASDGNLYGATNGGGPEGVGTIYRYNPNGAYAVIHTFTGLQGAFPNSSLVQARGTTKLYGATTYGGATFMTDNGGVVYSIDFAGNFNVVHSFSAGDNALNPVGGVLQGSDGNFYGATTQGGPAPNMGTVYQLTAGGVLQVLHAFAGGKTDGSYPQSGLVEGPNSVFYGTTEYGGATASGTVYSITPTKTFALVHALDGMNDGQYPFGNLVLEPNGSLYGVASYSGSRQNGTLFTVAPGGAFSVVHNFIGGATEGSHPNTGLVEVNRVLYGVTMSGGPANTGTLFKLPLTVRFDFNVDGSADIVFQSQSNGSVPYETLNGVTPASFGYLFQGVAGDYKVAGVADLNGDGKPDVLFQNQATGDIAYTFLNGVTPGASGYLFRGLDPNLKLVGTPDLNGDGHPDLLFENMKTGDVLYALMNGTTTLTPTSYGTLFQRIPLEHQIVGTPDLNGDGFEDIVFQGQTNGDVSYVLLNNLAVTGSGYLFRHISLDYKIVGIH